MKIDILRHNCGMWKFVSGDSTNCPFYWKMRGGDSYHGNLYFFTLFGIRLVIDTVKKKELWVR